MACSTDGRDPDPQAGRGRRRPRGRRRLAGGAGLVQAGVLPGRYRAGRLLGACDVGGPPPTTVAPGPLRLASFPSRRRGRAVGYGIAWPPGSGPGDRLPVVVLLHAAAGNERTPFDRLRLHHHLAEAVGAGGARPFALASADGAGSGWRPTAGDDPLGMVVDELLPLLSGLGLRTGPDSLGVLGWSAGGAAALRLVEGDPGRVAALAAASPAVTRNGAEVAAAGRLTGLAVRGQRPLRRRRPGPGRRPPHRHDHGGQGLPRRRLLAAGGPGPAPLPGRHPGRSPGGPGVTESTGGR